MRLKPARPTSRLDCRPPDQRSGRWTAWARLSEAAHDGILVAVARHTGELDAIAVGQVDLGSLITGITDESKYVLVAGAVAGGGLTIIANAPTPAGVALLKRGFEDE
jgi:hypothetical protein